MYPSYPNWSDPDDVPTRKQVRVSVAAAAAAPAPARRRLSIGELVWAVLLAAGFAGFGGAVLWLAFRAFG